MLVFQSLHQQRCADELAMADRPSRVPHVALVLVRGLSQIRPHSIYVNLQHVEETIQQITTIDRRLRVGLQRQEEGFKVNTCWTFQVGIRCMQDQRVLGRFALFRYIALLSASSQSFCDTGEALLGELHRQQEAHLSTRRRIELLDK